MRPRHLLLQCTKHLVHTHLVNKYFVHTYLVHTYLVCHMLLHCAKHLVHCATHLVQWAKAGALTWCTVCAQAAGWCDYLTHGILWVTGACKYMQVDTPLPPYIAF